MTQPKHCRVTAGAGRKIVRRGGAAAAMEIGDRNVDVCEDPRWRAVGVYCCRAGLGPPLVGGGRPLLAGRTVAPAGGRWASTAVGQDWGPRWRAVGVCCCRAGLAPPLVGGGRRLLSGRTGSSAGGQDWGPRWRAVGVCCCRAGLAPPLAGGGRRLLSGRTGSSAGGRQASTAVGQDLLRALFRRAPRAQRAGRSTNRSFWSRLPGPQRRRSRRMRDRPDPGRRRGLNPATCPSWPGRAACAWRGEARRGPDRRHDPDPDLDDDPDLDHGPDLELDRDHGRGRGDRGLSDGPGDRARGPGRGGGQDLPPASPGRPDPSRRGG